jgi:predicted nucleotidyltransferase
MSGTGGIRLKAGTLDMETVRQYHRARMAQQREQREQLRLHWLQRVRAAILRVAPRHPGVRRVILFGSLIKAGQFRSDSDIDVAVECDTLEGESALWHALERELERDIDMRSLSDTVAKIAAREGEVVYGRQSPLLDQ